MKEEILPNGNHRLTSPNGIRDKRRGDIHSEVVCKPENVSLYEDADDSANDSANDSK